jgi:tRNA U34 2-thiouridine synthase MnmA/TrmU
MRNWDTRDESGTDVGCEWEKDWEDVQRVCRKLDIPCQMVCEHPPFDPVAFDTTKKNLGRSLEGILAKSI